MGTRRRRFPSLGFMSCGHEELFRDGFVAVGYFQPPDADVLKLEYLGKGDAESVIDVLLAGIKKTI
jgi:hypothetical protein